MFSLQKWRAEDGAAAVEYGLLVGLIAVFIIASVTALGGNIGAKFLEASCRLQAKTYTGPNPTATPPDLDGSCA